MTWSPPTLNTNGTSLSDLVGFRIYYGTSPTNLTESVTLSGPTTTTYVVTGLPSGTFYFAVAAFNSAGVASAKTNVVSKSIP